MPQWWDRGGSCAGGKGCQDRGQRGLWGSPVHPFLQLSQAGHLASIVPAHLLRLYHLLLFTLPGTPVFSFGDEIGLNAAALPGQVFGAASPAQVGGGRVYPTRRFCGFGQTGMNLVVVVCLMPSHSPSWWRCGFACYVPSPVTSPVITAFLVG